MRSVDDAIILSEDIVCSLGEMNERQRTVILASMLGFTQAEIATMLGVSQQTVSIIFRQGKLILGLVNTP